MKFIARSRERCPTCKTRLVRLAGSLTCENWNCASSPVATLRSVRDAAPAVPPGYRPAQHVPPAVVEPGRRLPCHEPPAPPARPPSRGVKAPPCSPDILRDMILSDVEYRAQR